jgi:hypothetical protein
MRWFYIAVAIVGLGVGAVAAYLASQEWVCVYPLEPPGEFISGPQVGSKLPGPFEPLNINGADAGDEACLFCKYGNAPVVMIFASKPSDALTSLVQKVEKAAAGASRDEIGACVVVTDASAETKTALNKLAGKENLKHVVLGMIEAEKMKQYELHPDAVVTVLLYSNQVVRLNRAFKTGELTEKAIAELAEETTKHYAAK